jgi:hypothetical protein
MTTAVYIVTKKYNISLHYTLMEVNLCYEMPVSMEALIA